jgi:hypothetical protein
MKLNAKDLSKINPKTEVNPIYFTIEDLEELETLNNNALCNVGHGFISPIQFILDHMKAYNLAEIHEEMVYEKEGEMHYSDDEGKQWTFDVIRIHLGVPMPR